VLGAYGFKSIFAPPPSKSIVNGYRKIQCMATNGDEGRLCQILNCGEYGTDPLRNDIIYRI
jgi:hypothetical protein